VAIGAIGLLGLAIGSLEAIAWPVTAAVLGIAAAVAGVALVIANWNTVVRALNDPLGVLTGRFGVVGQVIGGLVAPVALLIGPFVALGMAIGRVVDWAGGVAGVGRIIGGVFGEIGHLLQIGPIAAFGEALSHLTAPLQGVIAFFGQWKDAAFVAGQMVHWLGDKLHDFLALLGLVNNGPGGSGAASALTQPRMIPGTVPARTVDAGMGLHLRVPAHPGLVVATAPQAAGFDLEANARRLSEVMFGSLNGAGSSIPRRNGGMALIGQPLQQHTHTHAGHTFHIAISQQPGQSHKELVQEIKDELARDADWDAHYTGGSTQGLTPGPYGF